MSQRTQFWIRAALVLIGAAFLAQIILAAFSISIFVEGPIIGGLVWGKVTLVDLYLGFLISLLFLWMLEPRKTLVLIFIPVFLLMGNWLLCWYIAWRWPHLFRN